MPPPYGELGGDPGEVFADRMQSSSANRETADGWSSASRRTHRSVHDEWRRGACPTWRDGPVAVRPVYGAVARLPATP